MIYPLHQLKPKTKTKTQNNIFGKHWYFSQIVSKKAKIITSFFMKKSKNNKIILGFSFMYLVSVYPMDRSMNMIYFFLCFTSWYNNSRLSFLISNIFINKSQGRSIVYCVFGQKWPRGYITSEKRCKIDAYRLLAIIRSCFEVHVAGTLTRGWGRGRGGGCCSLSSYNRLVIKDGRWTMRTHRIQCLKK